MPGVELQVQLAELRAREGVDARAGRERMPVERGRAGVPGERGGAGYSRESAAELYNSRQIWILVIGPRLNKVTAALFLDLVKQPFATGS